MPGPINSAWVAFSLDLASITVLPCDPLISETSWSQVSDLMMGCAFVNSKRGEEAAGDAQARATVAAAIAAGIRDFDTA
eukprot:COSAG02_NODE_140_length_34374_cov_913.416443_21_plen_79_part_00